MKFWVAWISIIAVLRWVRADIGLHRAEHWLDWAVIGADRALHGVYRAGARGDRADSEKHRAEALLNFIKKPAHEELMRWFGCIYKF
ncbi:hypothetical protein CSV63_15375 [Sporosarcina sp. P34]|nr:hypothetical protein CSV63_15375 [Sporosarcina sp. P34]